MTPTVMPVCTAVWMKTGLTRRSALNWKQSSSSVTVTTNAKTISSAGIQTRLTKKLNSKHACPFIANLRALNLDGTLKAKMHQLWKTLRKTECIARVVWHILTAKMELGAPTWKRWNGMTKYSSSHINAILSSWTSSVSCSSTSMKVTLTMLMILQLRETSLEINASALWMVRLTTVTALVLRTKKIALSLGKWTLLWKTRKFQGLLQGAIALASWGMNLLKMLTKHTPLWWKDQTATQETDSTWELRKTKPVVLEPRRTNLDLRSTKCST